MGVFSMKKSGTNWGPHGFAMQICGAEKVGQIPPLGGAVRSLTFDLLREVKLPFQMGVILGKTKYSFGDRDLHMPVIGESFFRRMQHQRANAGSHLFSSLRKCSLDASRNARVDLIPYGIKLIPRGTLSIKEGELSVMPPLRRGGYTCESVDVLRPLERPKDYQDMKVPYGYG